GPGLHVVHEVAADVVSRAGVAPDGPPRQVRMALRQQRKLDLAGDLDLVTGEKLVLQLEHDDDQKDDDRPGPCREPDGRAREPEVRVEHREEESDDDEDAAGRREPEEKALPQPQGPPDEPPQAAHLLETGPLLLVQVETLEVAKVL